MEQRTGSSFRANEAKLMTRARPPLRGTNRNCLRFSARSRRVRVSWRKALLMASRVSGTDATVPRQARYARSSFKELCSLRSRGILIEDQRDIEHRNLERTIRTNDAPRRSSDILAKRKSIPIGSSHPSSSPSLAGASNI